MECSVERESWPPTHILDERLQQELHIHEISVILL